MVHHSEPLNTAVFTLKTTDITRLTLQIWQTIIARSPSKPRGEKQADDQWVAGVYFTTAWWLRRKGKWRRWRSIMLGTNTRLWIGLVWHEINTQVHGHMTESDYGAVRSEEWRTRSIALLQVDRWMFRKDSPLPPPHANKEALRRHWHIFERNCILPNPIIFDTL